MSVFKRTYTGKGGKTKSIQKWSVDFRDHDGIVRRVAAFKDRSASLELERSLKKLVALRMAGAGPDAELSRFPESCPGEIREKLADWNIISGERAAAGRDIDRHVADWRIELEARGNTDRHVKTFTSKVTAVANACQWRFLTDISLLDAQNWLTDQKRAGKSAATCNTYIRASKGFCAWLVKEKRANENPLAYWSLLNEKSDRRYQRHAFTLEEMGLLLAATEDGPVHHGMTGVDRALLYRTAVETGFRWSELHSLTRGSFDFNAEPASLTIQAAYAKNGKEDTITLRNELAADLKSRMGLFLPAAKAFTGMWKDKGAAIIREDLEAAGILSRDSDDNLVITDEYGMIYDFHCLRATFATLLNKARVPLATAQRLMRHSDPKLTANIYTHVMLDDKAEALAKLPNITAKRAEDEGIAKTGTNDAPASKDDKIVVMKIDSSGTDSMANIRTYADSGRGGDRPFGNGLENAKTPVPQGQTGVQYMEPTVGFEPTTCALRKREAIL
ncbi:MAG: tyrosine-type recombinase/integrase [Planctomycetaceae bacterium]|nr:tyrosine-type recombinase/integrase [Planctomycetaceae bacterium]